MIGSHPDAWAASAASKKRFMRHAIVLALIAALSFTAPIAVLALAYGAYDLAHRLTREANNSACAAAEVC